MEVATKAIKHIDLSTIDKLSYDGDGIFIVRLPYGSSQRVLDGLFRTWKTAWEKVGSESPPAVILAHDVELEHVSDDGLRRMGLKRIEKTEKTNE